MILYFQYKLGGYWSLQTVEMDRRYIRYISFIIFVSGKTFSMFSSWSSVIGIYKPSLFWAAISSQCWDGII